MRWRAFFLAVLLLFPSPGWTALSEHFDLASLVHMSRYVVLAERGEKRVLSKYVTATKYRVRKVYRGDMTPGQEIEILGSFDATYGRGRLVSVPRTQQGGFSWDPETVLFLTEVSGRSSIPAGAPALTTVASGMRVLSQGKVYRFEQIENPGGYGPVPQGRDPEDLWLSDDMMPVDYQTFEEDLRNALARAARFESIWAAPRDATRTQALLELLGPAMVPSAVDLVASDPLGPADAIARETYNTFVRDGAIEAALDAFSRCRKRFGQWSMRERPSAAAVLAIARDPAQPLPRRMAAIWGAMDYISFPEFPQWRPLLEDAVADVRMAAACLFGELLQWRRSNPHLLTEESFVTCLEALAACWNREKDPGVRAVILRGIAGIESAERYFNALKFTRHRTPIDPAYVVADIETLVAGRLYCARVVYGGVASTRLRFRDWTLVMSRKGGEETRRHPLGDERLTPAAFSATDRDAIERTADGRLRQAIAEVLDRRHASWCRTSGRGQEEKGARFPSLLVPPLPPGAYEFRVEVTAESEQPVVLRSGAVTLSVE